MFEDLSIPMKNVKVSLAASTLGVFEPVSCMVFFNLTDEEFTTWQTDSQPPWDQVGANLAHEMHHYLQTISTGFMYDQYQRQLFALRKSKPPPKVMWHSLRTVVRGMAQGPIDRVRYFRLSPDVRAQVTASNRFWDALIDQWDTEKLAAEYGVRTMGGVILPNLADDVERARGSARVRGASGLSAQDVFEGSAVVYALVNDHGHEGADDRLRKQDLQDDWPYDRLAKRSLERCNDRPVSAPLLTAAALALRFERPGDAFFPVFDRLLYEPPGVELDVARRMDLGSITEAGSLLGTASDARAAGRAYKKRSGYVDVEWYTTALDLASEWPVDELRLVADPAALGDIPIGQFTFGIVTRDSARAAPAGEMHLNFRRMLGALMLRSGLSVIGPRKELLEYFSEHRSQLLP